MKRSTATAKIIAVFTACLLLAGCEKAVEPTTATVTETVEKQTEVLVGSEQDKLQTKMLSNQFEINLTYASKLWEISKSACFSPARTYNDENLKKASFMLHEFTDPPQTMKVWLISNAQGC